MFPQTIFACDSFCFLNGNPVWRYSRTFLLIWSIDSHVLWFYGKHDRICPSSNQYRQSKICKRKTKSYAASRKKLVSLDRSPSTRFPYNRPVAVLSKRSRFNFPVMFSYNLQDRPYTMSSGNRGDYMELAFVNRQILGHIRKYFFKERILIWLSALRLL